VPSLLDIDALRNLLHQSGFSQIDKLLLCASFDVNNPKSVKTIKEIAKQAGFRITDKWNVSSLLSRSGGLAIRTDNGWELTNNGKERVAQLAGMAILSVTPKVASSLRSHLSSISNHETTAFLEEAIRCYETKLYRSAVVLTWVGAISVLYDYVMSHKLVEFNAEAAKRNAKWKIAKIKDDLANMKEHDFLQVLHVISVIGKSVKDELEGCLKFRNGCGHPNSLKIGESRVSGHIETLMLNVFSKF
jgi:hypothetical protein